MHMLVLFFLVFWGTSILFSRVASPTHIPTNSVPGFIFSTSSPTFVTCRLYDDSHFDRCEVISYSGFNLHFSDDKQYFINQLSICHMYVCFGRNVCLGILPFINWIFWVVLILNYMNCLFILDITPLSVVSFANIFFLSIGHLFVFLTFYFIAKIKS